MCKISAKSQDGVPGHLGYPILRFLRISDHSKIITNITVITQFFNFCGVDHMKCLSAMKDRGFGYIRARHAAVSV